MSKIINYKNEHQKQEAMENGDRKQDSQQTRLETSRREMRCQPKREENFHNRNSNSPLGLKGAVSRRLKANKRGEDVFVVCWLQIKIIFQFCTLFVGKQKCSSLSFVYFILFNLI